MEFVMAALAAAIIVWFLASAWIPAIRQTVKQLPAQSGIREGKLQWPGTAPVRLAEGKFLSILVNPGPSMEMGQTADLQWEFQGEELRLRSLFGYVSVPYPTGWIIALNRSEFEPWWGAWEPAILAGAGVLVVCSLLFGWSVLAAAYLWPVLAVAWLADRHVNLATAWKLGSAALMPGAALMSGAILLYGLGRLPLVGLLCGLAAYCRRLGLSLDLSASAAAALRLHQLVPKSFPGDGSGCQSRIAKPQRRGVTLFCSLSSEPE